jgi:hypothetical protein
VQSPKLKPRSTKNKQIKKTTNFVFIFTSAPKNEACSIIITKVRRSGLSNGGTFDEIITDMLCLCKDCEGYALADELECCIRRPICVPRSVQTLRGAVRDGHSLVVSSLNQELCRALTSSWEVSVRLWKETMASKKAKEIWTLTVR